MSQRPLKPSPRPDAAIFASESNQAARDQAARERESARREALAALVVARRQPSPDAKKVLREALLQQMADRGTSLSRERVRPSSRTSLPAGEDASLTRGRWAREAAEVNQHLIVAKRERAARERRQSIAADAAVAAEAARLDDWGRCAR